MQIQRRATKYGQVLSSYSGEIRSLALFSMVINLSWLTPSVYMLQVYDRVLPSRNEYTLANAEWHCFGDQQPAQRGGDPGHGHASGPAAPLGRTAPAVCKAPVGRKPAGRHGGAWSGAKTAYARVSALLAKHPQQPAGMALPAPTGRVTMDSVTAVPPGAQTPALRNVSFELMPGDVLGVVGPCGAGKSTLARMLVGVWPSSVGQVRLDGADVYLWNKVLSPGLCSLEPMP